MTVSLIWAEAAGRVIGRDGGLPWRLPEDQQLFKQLTMAATVIMGPSTWESLPASARPLPGRRDAVHARQPGWSAAGAVAAHSLDEALSSADGDVWVIGGARVYAAALGLADQVVRTRVHMHVDGDTYAPRLGPEWAQIARDPAEGLHTSTSGLTYCVATFRRVD